MEATMMRQLPVIVLGFALVLPGMAARAQPSGDAALTAGLGNAKCSDFLTSEGEARAAYIAWAEGYMSGINHAVETYRDTPIPLYGDDTMSAERQLAYMVEHCEISPDAPFFSAAADLFSALSNVAGQ
jgi:hypothetical protein